MHRRDSACPVLAEFTIKIGRNRAMKPSFQRLREHWLATRNKPDPLGVVAQLLQLKIGDQLSDALVGLGEKVPSHVDSRVDLRHFHVPILFEFIPEVGDQSHLQFPAAVQGPSEPRGREARPVLQSRAQPSGALPCPKTLRPKTYRPTLKRPTPSFPNSTPSTPRPPKPPPTTSPASPSAPARRRRRTFPSASWRAGTSKPSPT